MTTQIIDLSQIDLTGGLRLNGEAFRAAHINGERLWPFGVDLLYTGGIGGASYLPDPTDVYGASALAAFGDGVSAVLDEKNGTPVLGPELIVNGTFDTDLSGWVIGSNLVPTWENGEARCQNINNNGSFTTLSQSFPTVIGRAYLVSAKTRSPSGGNCRILGFGGFANQSIEVGSADRTNSVVFVASTTASTVAIANNSGNALWYCDNVSVREIPGLHARQPSTSLRPLLGRAPKAGARNRIIFSEQFENAVWTKTGGTISADVAIAPDGTVSADRLVEDAGTINGATVRSQNFQWLGAGSLLAAVSIYAKEVAGSAKRYLVFGVDIQSTRWAYLIVDLATGTVTATRTDGIQTGIVPGSISVEPAEHGFYRVSFVATSPLAGSSYYLRAGVTDNPTPTFTSFQIPPYTGDGASGIMLWGGYAEPGSVVRPYQRVGANLLDTTEPGVPSYPFVRFDLSDDRLDTVLPQAVTGDVVIAGRNGSVIAPHSYAANTTFQLGPTSYTGGTPGILRAIGDVVGWSILNKTLTVAERERLMRFYKRRGAKGLLVPGPELVTNGAFNTDLSGWSNSGSATWSSGGAAINQAGSVSILSQSAAIVPGKTYQFRCDCTSFTSGSLVLGTTTGSVVSAFVINGLGSFLGVVTAGAANNGIRLVSQSAGFVGTIDNISVRELRPEEEW